MFVYCHLPPMVLLLNHWGNNRWYLSGISRVLRFLPLWTGHPSYGTGYGYSSVGLPSTKCWKTHIHIQRRKVSSLFLSILNHTYTHTHTHTHSHTHTHTLLRLISWCNVPSRWTILKRPRSDTSKCYLQHDWAVIQTGTFLSLAMWFSTTCKQALTLTLTKEKTTRMSTLACSYIMY